MKIKKYEPVFEWFEKEKRAQCMIFDGKKKFYGHAKCHPDDIDMFSEKTGCEIAYYRARIAFYKDTRDELKNQFSALNHLYHTMKDSKYFNEKSYENKMLQRQLHQTKISLDTIKNLIATEEQNLREFIYVKDEFYKKVRKMRQLGQN